MLPVESKDYKMSSLNELGRKHGTDKATYHQYLDFYQEYLEPYKNSMSRMLEIGVKTGASIRMWRDWLPQHTQIEGWDIRNLPTIENTNLKIVDQTNKEQIYQNISGVYDFILDDGLHSQQSIETSFSCLFPFCKIYIIEDLHAPWCFKTYERGKFTIDLIETLMSENLWNSEFSDIQQAKYIMSFARVEKIFIRGTRNKPDSMSAIIKNLYYE